MKLLRNIPSGSSSKKIRTFNVGIDLGTNSTKVIYQIVESSSNEKAYVYDFNSRLSEFPPYTFPSIVVIDSNKFHFGDEAYLRKDSASAIFSSFKMCLACYKNIFECKKCNSQGISTFLNGSCEINGRKINPAIISLLYLAYVIGKVTKFVQNRYKDQFDLKFYYNISFPLEFLSAKKKFFEGIANYAEKLKEDVYQGISINQVFQLSKEIKKKIGSHINPEDKIVYVIEETRAAMHSFIKSEYLPEGLYAIVDVGASTTDISFFRYAGAEDVEPEFIFYADHSYILGGDDFDRALMDKVIIDIGNKQHLSTTELLFEIRRAKHNSYENAKFSIPSINILWDFEKLEKICQSLFENLHEEFSKTLRDKAYRKEQDIKRWKKLNIIFIGGGSKWEVLPNIFSSSPFHGKQAKWLPKFHTDMLSLPDNLNIKNIAISTYELRKNFLYFYVAHGLSYFHQEITGFFPPEEVTDFKPVQIHAERKDRDKLYPK